MKLQSKINTYEIENSNNNIFINNDRVEFKIEQISTNIFKIINGDKSITAYGAKYKDRYFINIEGHQFSFNEVDNHFSASSENLNRAEIVPPMPGSVVKILVSTGDIIEEGTPLIVVEAMKMETKIYSPINGVVKEINVKEKQQVNPDNYMILIEKNE
jgi:biotin carboxyl carrier protein